MFCHKCGNQLLDGASFCPKCGAKQITDNKAQQTVSSGAANIPEPMRVIDKLFRKSKILTFGIIGLVALIAIVAALFGGIGGNDKYVQMVKDGTLNGYPQKTVGKAFDDYLSKPQWESGMSEDGERFVNVRGGILYLDKEVDLVVQFFVDEENETFSYSESEMNGIPQNDLIFWGLLEAVYNEDSASTSANGGTTEITEDEALEIAQKFLDDHPLYKRTIVGIGEHGDTSYDNMDISNMHRIHMVDNDGEDKAMWVDRTTGDIFISADGETLLSGKEFYELMYLKIKPEPEAHFPTKFI